MRVFHTREPIVSIEVTDIERKIIIKALTNLREQQIRENKNYDFIETIIDKSALAKCKKGKTRYEER